MNRVIHWSADKNTTDSPAQDFSTTIGRHSYVGISQTPNGPYVTLYYNIMIFSTGAELDEESGKLTGPASKRQRHVI